MKIFFIGEKIPEKVSEVLKKHFGEEKIFLYEPKRARKNRFPESEDGVLLILGVPDSLALAARAWAKMIPAVIFRGADSLEEKIKKHKEVYKRAMEYGPTKTPEYGEGVRRALELA